MNSIHHSCSLSLRKQKFNTYPVDNLSMPNYPYRDSIEDGDSLNFDSLNCSGNENACSPDKENLIKTQNIILEELNADIDPLEFVEIVNIVSQKLDDQAESNSFGLDPLEICEKNTNNIRVSFDKNVPVQSISFSVTSCDKVDIRSNKSNIKKVSLSHRESKIHVDCELIEGSQLSDVTDYEKHLMGDTNVCSQQKRKTVTVNLEIKKQKLTTSKQSTEKVLILKTNAIEKLTHVIVQPPNYKLVKRNINDKRKVENSKRKSAFWSEKNVKGVKGHRLKQKSIKDFCNTNVLKTKQSLDSSAVQLVNNNVWHNNCKRKKLVRDDAQEMNKNSGVVDIKYDGRTSFKSNRNDSSKTPRTMQRSPSPKHETKASVSDVPGTISPRSKKDSAGSFSPRRHMESIQFNLPLKSKSNKTSIAARNNIPHYKIVAGTHFAVDAFSYGEIPNVKHYFLTHFHSDHYSGLKKSFNKLLFCSKITADLCISRLGVNSKYIQVLNVDEMIRIEGVEVTVVDANHCPGSIMLVFTLPNGKTMLHTGDFRASPNMESFPVFWNRDVHTIYLDTTYCNPRYDFPTQDQSLEMALSLLRQKKMDLEKVGKKFSSVLIVCGTYTIGKEKFFLGMARRVGCSVWACPEKDRVLQAVEGHSFSHASPQSCQLHVVPMRDLTHEKLRRYLDSLQGAFSEVVAFKPSGWENGRNSSTEKDSVTIHGIPYSEHSSFSELIRFVKFLKPKQVVPTVDISGGIKAVEKYFPCPLVNKDEIQCQTKVTDFFRIKSRQQIAAVT